MSGEFQALYDAAPDAAGAPPGQQGDALAARAGTGQQEGGARVVTGLGGVREHHERVGARGVVERLLAAVEPVAPGVPHGREAVVQEVVAGGRLGVGARHPAAGQQQVGGAPPLLPGAARPDDGRRQVRGHPVAEAEGGVPAEDGAQDPGEHVEAVEPAAEFARDELGVQPEGVEDPFPDGQKLLPSVGGEDVVRAQRVAGVVEIAELVLEPCCTFPHGPLGGLRPVHHRGHGCLRPRLGRAPAPA